MFKCFKKNNLSQPSIFWRYVVIIFGVGLLLVFVGQALIMFVVGGSGLDQPITPSNNDLSGGFESQKVNQLLKELNDRPMRLKNILATTTVFIDPSL